MYNRVQRVSQLLYQSILTILVPSICGFSCYGVFSILRRAKKVTIKEASDLMAMRVYQRTITKRTRRIIAKLDSQSLSTLDEILRFGAEERERIKLSLTVLSLYTQEMVGWPIYSRLMAKLEDFMLVNHYRLEEKTVSYGRVKVYPSHLELNEELAQLPVFDRVELMQIG